MPNQAVKNGLKAKKIKLLQINFFSRKAIKFSCTYQPLSFCKILKQFLELLQSYQDVPNLFWYKPLLFLSFTLLALYCWPFSLCKTSKKILQPIEIREDVPSLGPRWCICPLKKKFSEEIY